MYSKINYTIVGLFVMIFTVGLVWFGIWLAKYGLEDSYSTYRLEMRESVSGLSKDSNVQLHGVTIGRVSDIRINPENIEVIEIRLEIKSEIPIKEDMVAFTQMLGVTGLLSIGIEGGSNSARSLLPTDDFIPLIPSRPSSLTKLANHLTSVSERLNHLLGQSDKLFTDENIASMNRILANVEVLTKEGIAVEADAKHALHTFSSTAVDINDTFSTATKDFKIMQQDFAKIKSVTVPTVEKLMQTITDFKRVTLKFERSLDRGDYSIKKLMGPAVIDMQLLLKDMTRLSREIGQNPRDILFKSRQPRRGPGE